MMKAALDPMAPVLIGRHVKSQESRMPCEDDSVDWSNNKPRAVGNYLELGKRRGIGFSLGLSKGAGP